MRRLVLLAGLMMVILIAVMPTHAQNYTSHEDRSQARSMVITPLGIVATSQTLASQAGAQILARGGSAVDAAIAADAAMGVVEPMNSGIGGDLFAIHYDAKTGRLAGMNASGWAPEKLTVDFLKHKGYAQMPQSGVFSITVPGCVDGWARMHEKYGRLPWAELFKPAIYFAEHGFPLTEYIDAYWKGGQRLLETNANARRIYLPDGRPPEVGEVFTNSEYGRALELIAKQGRDAFYRGDIAKDIVKSVEELGGVMSLSDFSEYQAQWVEPISTTYRGWKIYELPPNGQGLAALEMLNVFERYPLPDWGFFNVDALHVKMEAQRLAFADLRRYVGDPKYSKIPVEGLISKEYAAQRAATIDMNHAHCDVPPGNPPHASNDTIYLSVVDKEGNIVSLIQSLSAGFGSGVVSNDYGILLQNRGGMFVLEAGHPDVLMPHKRPYHTIIPAFMAKGDIHIGFGIMGGYNQPQAHAQFVSDIVDYGMNIQAALEAPRFTKLDWGGCNFMIEDRFPPFIYEGLEQKGHVLIMRGAYASPMGGGQAVLHNSATGINYGASSPRKDGAAIPEPAPYFEPGK
ncbi:MAG: gamma-glutamyltransferase [Acidobacteria bacterium]|nr:MAG: gamma-glutamyltransferase [Acidobacteriota bacterium]